MGFYPRTQLCFLENKAFYVNASIYTIVNG